MIFQLSSSSVQLFSIPVSTYKLCSYVFLYSYITDLESYVVLYMIAGTGIGDSVVDDNWNMIADNWNWEELSNNNWNMSAAASVILICMAHWHWLIFDFLKITKQWKGLQLGANVYLVLCSWWHVSYSQMGLNFVL